MTLRMNLREGTLNIVDAIKIGTAVVAFVVGFVTLKNDNTYTKEALQEIRQTQLENSRKNEVKDEIINKRLSQLEINNKLMEQRLENLEKKR